MKCYILADCNQYIYNPIAAFSSIEKELIYQNKFYFNQKNIISFTIDVSGKLKKKY